MKNPLADLELALLLAFEALLRDRNITWAARRLEITQPAMSARLARLREVFNDRLFVPAANGRGIVPTPRATKLEPALVATLDSLRRLVEADQGFDPATSTRTFTIAMHDNPAMMIGAALIGRVHRHAPQVTIVIVMPDPKLISEDLEIGRVDLLVGRAAGADPQWISRTLVSDDFVTAQRKGHPRGDGPLDLDVFCAHDHLLISAGGRGLSGVVDEALAAQGRARRVSASIQSYALAPFVIEGSDLLCTLPRRLLAHFVLTLDLFAPPVDLGAFELSSFWHLRSQDDEGHSWLRSQLADTGRMITA